MALWRPDTIKTIVSKYASRCYWCGRPVMSGTLAEWYVKEKMVVHQKCHLDAYTS